MRCRPGYGHAPALRLQQADDLGRERGEGGQCAQKASDDGQPPDWVELG